jgi:tetratricopeptide (TPR) repeat protein
MRKFEIAISLVVAVSSAVAQSAAADLQDASAKPAPTFEEASALAGKGRLDQALADLNTLATQKPEPAGVERLRGIIFYQKDQLTEAEATLAKAVMQDPSDREAKEMRGITLYRLGRPAEAIPLLEATEGSTANTSNAEPHYVLGLCYTDAKRYDDARRAFAEQFGFAPDSAEAYLVTARLFLRREFADKAQEFAQKAVELNPGLPRAHELLGEIALAKADLPAAVKELEAERKLNPLDGDVYDRLGDAYVRNGDYEKAREALDKAVLLEPNATGPYILLGTALVKLGQPGQALHYLVRAESMDPNNYVTHNALGQAYRALGDMAQANREYKMAVAIQHRDDPKPVQVK